MTDQKTPKYSAAQTNQRSALRAPLIVERIACEDALKTFFGYAKNISRGGLFVSTLKPREPGEQFDIELTLPLPQPLHVRCRVEVVWKRHFVRKGAHEPGMGLRFIELADDIGVRIDDWISSQAAGSKK